MPEPLTAADIHPDRLTAGEQVSGRRGSTVYLAVPTETGARRGELIQRQGCAREFGEDRQQPGPGRGLEHDVGGRQPRRDARHETERQRG